MRGKRRAERSKHAFMPVMKTTTTTTTTTMMMMITMVLAVDIAFSHYHIVVIRTSLEWILLWIRNELVCGDDDDEKGEEKLPLALALYGEKRVCST
jgi:hypothetical protein